VIAERRVFRLSHSAAHRKVRWALTIELEHRNGTRASGKHVIRFDLPHLNACFIKAYAAETTEAIRVTLDETPDGVFAMQCKYC
jgi:hypothetical protein